MAHSVGKIVGELVLDTSKFQKNVGKAEASIDTLGKTAKGKASKGLGQLKSQAFALAGIGGIGAIAVGA